jgi:shikimate dehydrogenase
MDLVYGQGPTPFVRAAVEAGIAAADGAEMLVGQGGAAFARWWGRPAPLGVMRAALARGTAIGARG